MWLCLCRLKGKGKEGVELGQYVYEINNNDLKLGVSNAGVSLVAEGKEHVVFGFYMTICI